MSWVLLRGLLLLGDRLDLSALGGEHPLRPPTGHSLGEPLPHQLADRPHAHPYPACAFTQNVSVTHFGTIGN
jgi:hypothetical protein